MFPISQGAPNWFLLPNSNNPQQTNEGEEKETVALSEADTLLLNDREKLINLLRAFPISTPQEKRRAFRIFNALAMPENHTKWNRMFNGINGSVDMRTTYMEIFVDELLELPGDPYPHIHGKVVGLLFDLPTIENISRLIKYSQNPRIKAKLLDSSNQFLFKSFRDYFVMSEDVKKKFRELLNCATGPEYKQLWTDLQNGAMMPLRQMYLDIVKEKKSPEYVPTPLHKKLFEILSEDPAENMSLLADDMQIPAFRDLFQAKIGKLEYSEKYFKFFVTLLSKGSSDHGLHLKETKIKLLKDGINFYLQKKISPELFNTLIYFLDQQNCLELWNHIPKEQLSNFLIRVLDTRSEKFEESILYHVHKTFEKEMQTDEFAKDFSELSTDVKYQFFAILNRCAKLNSVPSSLFQQFSNYVKTLPQNLRTQQVFDTWNKLATQVKAPPFEFLSIISRFAHLFPKKGFFLTTQVPEYVQVREYLGRLGIMPNSDLVSAYYEACTRVFVNLDEIERERYFRIAVLQNRTKDFRGEILIGYLEHFTKTPLVTKDDKMHSQQYFQLFSEKIKEIFLQIKNETDFPVPLILKFLDHQRQLMSKEGFLCGELYKEILGKQLNSQQFKEINSYLEQLKTFEDPKDKINLSVMALYFACAAQMAQDTKEGLSDSVRSILAKIKLSSIPETIFLKELSDGAFRSIIEREPYPLFQTATEDHLEKFYKPREMHLGVNEGHLKVAQSEKATEIPALPAGEKIEYEELIKMFGEINFTDPSKPDYVNPDNLKDEKDSITREQAEAGVRSFVAKVNNPKGPAYSPTEPEAHRKYMELLEKWVKHSILELRARKPSERSGFLLWIASAGRHCGGNIYPTAQDLYRQLTGAKASYEDETLQGFIAIKLAEKRLGIFDDLFMRVTKDEGQSGHIKIHAMKHAGKEFNVKGWQDFDNHTDELVGRGGYGAVLCDDASLASFVDCCKEAYKATVIINEMTKHINGVHGAPRTITQNSAFRQLALEPWFKANMPKDFQTNFVLKRRDTVLKKDREAIRDAEIANFENDWFRRVVEREYDWNKDVSVELEVVHQADVRLQTFFDNYEDNHEGCTKKQVVDACIEHFDPQAKRGINRNDVKQAILAKHKDLEPRKVEKEVDKVREQEFSGQYFKGILRSDEYNAAVLEEIYSRDESTGVLFMKREWIIYMLENLGKEDRTNVLSTLRGRATVKKPVNIEEVINSLRTIRQVSSATQGNYSSSATQGDYSSTGNSTSLQTVAYINKH